MAGWLRWALDTLGRFNVEKAWDFLFGENGALRKGGDWLSWGVSMLVTVVGLAQDIPWMYVLVGATVAWAAIYHVSVMREFNSKNSVDGKKLVTTTRSLKDVLASAREDDIKKIPEHPNVKFVIIGDINGGFLRMTRKLRTAGDVEDCRETLSVRVEALKNLANTSIRLTVLGGADGNIGPVACCKEDFSGAVPKGAVVTIELVERSFVLQPTSFEIYDGRFKRKALARLNETAILLPEVLPTPINLGSGVQIKIDVLHDAGPDAGAVFVRLDADEVVRSEVEWIRGNIFVDCGMFEVVATWPPF